MSIYDFPTLKAWQEHPEVIGRMISPDMVISMLTEHDSALTLEELAKTDTKAAGFWLALKGGAVTEYNVINGVDGSVGMKHQLLLTYLKAVGAVTEGFRQALIAYANPTVYPNASKTEHEFQIVKNTVKLVPVTSNKGYVVIELGADVQQHNPRLIGRKINPRTNKIIEERINNFYNVAEAGKYDCAVPLEWANAKLFVDDVYSVIVT